MNKDKDKEKIELLEPYKSNQNYAHKKSNNTKKKDKRTLEKDKQENSQKENTSNIDIQRKVDNNSKEYFWILILTIIVIFIIVTMIVKRINQ